MNKKTYSDKNGNEKIYEYDDKKYNARRNKEIYRLQKLKHYYNKKGQKEKVEAIDILINLEKRKAKGDNIDSTTIKTLLNHIDKLQKEIEQKQETIDKIMKELEELLGE